MYTMGRFFFKIIMHRIINISNIHTYIYFQQNLPDSHPNTFVALRTYLTFSILVIGGKNIFIILKCINPLRSNTSQKRCHTNLGTISIEKDILEKAFNLS